MSPLANGLFHGAITLSGNALCDQYMQNDPNEAAVELANRLECSSEKGEDIVNCLSRQTQQDIIKASNSMAVSILIFPICCLRQHLATPTHPPLQLNIGI